MEMTRLGSTELIVSRSGFGAIPIQRIDTNDAVYIVQKAFNNGINFFDTARGYTDSEIKLGKAFQGNRDKVIIATKSGATDSSKIATDLDISLKNLNTDYIDIFQFHNPKTLESVVSENGAYDVIAKAKQAGKIRHIGLTNHKLTVARQALKSGLFQTIQYPFNQLSSDNEVAFVKECLEHDIGFIGMKALSGGLITNAATSYAFLRQFSNVVPIWGIQFVWELDQILGFETTPPQMDQKMILQISKDKTELSGSFCRGCGYCMPCPVGIEINTAARIAFLLKRTVYEKFLDDDFKNHMLLIDKCVNCGKCRQSCPYELDTPQLLKKMLKEYETFYLEKTGKPIRG